MDEAAARRLVDVHTSDGEVFPANKRLLRPCLTLTPQVRAELRAEARVDVDTLTFDRVLIYLECLALGRAPPNYAAHFLQDLLTAGRALRCQSLVAFCEAKLGTLEARVKVHRWADVQRANAGGSVWLVLDGMVLDVKQWLPEHPGGSTIIPQQALGMDCARFFELFHTSRESFLYLQELYCGEVSALDLEQVPRPEAASEDFLSQLRSFTAWRISNDDVRAYKSF